MGLAGVEPGVGDGGDMVLEFEGGFGREVSYSVTSREMGRPEELLGGRRDDADAIVELGGRLCGEEFREGGSLSNRRPFSRSHARPPPPLGAHSCSSFFISSSSMSSCNA